MRKYLRWIPLILAICVMLHHYYKKGCWFDTSDISHEMIAISLLAVWMGAMI